MGRRPRRDQERRPEARGRRRRRPRARDVDVRTRAPEYGDDAKRRQQRPEGRRKEGVAPQSDDGGGASDPSRRFRKTRAGARRRLLGRGAAVGRPPRRSGGARGDVEATRRRRRDARTPRSERDRRGDRRAAPPIAKLFRSVCGAAFRSPSSCGRRRRRAQAARGAERSAAAAKGEEILSGAPSDSRRPCPRRLISVADIRTTAAVPSTFVRTTCVTEGGCAVDVASPHPPHAATGVSGSWRTLQVARPDSAASRKKIEQLPRASGRRSLEAQAARSPASLGSSSSSSTSSSGAHAPPWQIASASLRALPQRPRASASTSASPPPPRRPPPRTTSAPALLRLLLLLLLADEPVEPGGGDVWRRKRRWRERNRVFSWNVPLPLGDRRPAVLRQMGWMLLPLVERRVMLNASSVGCSGRRAGDGERPLRSAAAARAPSRRRGVARDAASGDPRGLLAARSAIVGGVPVKAATNGLGAALAVLPSGCRNDARGNADAERHRRRDENDHSRATFTFDHPFSDGSIADDLPPRAGARTSRRAPRRVPRYAARPASAVPAPRGGPTRGVARGDVAARDVAW